MSLDDNAHFELEVRGDGPPGASTGPEPRSSAGPSPTAQPSAEAAPTVVLSSEDAAPSAPAIDAGTPISAKVQAVKRRADRPRAAKLEQWSAKQLKSGPDPLGKGIALMLDKGADSALFLAIAAPPEGSPVPHFNASAALGASEKLKLWTGMKWDPTVVPELWNVFVRAGFVELSPPGTNTNIKSNRNVVRAAFGVTQNEWLLLVRAGPANNCRGVVALIAPKSLLTELAPALPQLSAALPGSAKKAS